MLKFSKIGSILVNFNISYLSLNPSNIKIASFDLDSTIIKTKSGKIMPESRDDWTWFANITNIRQIMHKLVSKGYSIVVISNQKNLENRLTISEFQIKINDINNELGIDLHISWMFALEKDYFRKPMTGMFDYYVEIIKTYFNIFDINPKINLSESFYCGDAAGRIYPSIKKSKKKDHSCVDMFFANNNNIRFTTPEQLFLFDMTNYNICSPYNDINLTKIFKFSKSDSEQNLSDASNSDEITTFDCQNTFELICNKINMIKQTNKICILMVGCPGSGKSTLKKRILTKYPTMFNYSPDEKISMKTLTKHICTHDIIIDQTNPSFKSRSKIYNLLVSPAKHIYHFLIIHFNIDKLLCKHLNWTRYAKSVKNKCQKINTPIPDVVYNTYFKTFEDPNMDSSKLSDDYKINVININNIKSILDLDLITDEYINYYDI